MPRGLAGYAWAFPCLIDGAPHVNAGVYAWRRRPGVDLVALLRELKASSAGRQSAIRPLPFAVIRARRSSRRTCCWSATRPASSRSWARAFLSRSSTAAGRPAEILAARDRGDYAFDGAEGAFAAVGSAGSSAVSDEAATMFYGPGARLWLGLAARWPGAQEVGLRWYNGVDGFDRRSGWDAFRTALRWSLLAARRLVGCGKRWLPGRGALVQ